MLAAAPAAHAAPADPPLTVTLRAEVDRDGRTLRGTIQVDGALVSWTDPLASLPQPTHELDVQRTYPGLIDAGRMRWTRDGDLLRFETTLPRRWSDVGATAKGLFANGAWYPQPVVDGGLPLAAWDVKVTLAPGQHGAVGDVVGHEAGAEITWRGAAERVSLAVVPRGQVTQVEAPGTSVTLLTRGRPRAGLQRVLRRGALAVAGGAPLHAVAVEAPLRRRLARAGAGLAYLSDRTGRVTPGFQRLHAPATLAALASASSPEADPWERALTGALLDVEVRARLAARARFDLVGVTKWIPAVDAALYDQEMAFLGELFRRVHPTDRVRDDLTERFTVAGRPPPAPAAAVVAATADLVGEDVVRAVARDVAWGRRPSEAFARAGVPAALEAHGVDAGLLAGEPRLPSGGAQDLELRLRDGAATITRVAPADALAEPVVLRVDGVDRTVVLPPGPGEVRVDLDGPARRVVLDPERHIAQVSRLGDALPARWRWTLTGQISGINLSEGFVSAFAVLGLQRSDDTRNRVRLWLFTNQRDHLRGRLTYTRFEGPILRGATRRHALSVGAEIAWLNPRFADNLGARWAVGGSAAWTWDNQIYSLFPLRGLRVALGGAAGVAPETGDAYASVTGAVSVLAPAHPRLVLATRVDGGLAWSRLPARQLRFGGPGGVRGLPDDLLQTDRQLVVGAELRAVLLRGASVNLLGLTWAHELQLTLGVDAGLGRAGIGSGATGADGTPPPDGAPADPRTVAALGAVAGVGVTVDNLGMPPAAIHVQLGLPVATRGVPWPDGRRPVQVLVSWAQAF